VNHWQQRLRTLWWESRGGSNGVAIQHLRCGICGHLEFSDWSRQGLARVAELRGRMSDHLREQHPDAVAAAGVGPKVKPHYRRRAEPGTRS
jgi:hypothetical protein